VSSNAKLYNKIVVPYSNSYKTNPVRSQMYKGFSTISPDTRNFKLFDFELIKQDLLNHFHIRQGERLMNPRFGCVIWELLFEPLTDDLKNTIQRNVEDIINSDPRIKANQVIITSYETGVQIECVIEYLLYNVQEQIQLQFDQTNGLLTG